MRAVVQRVTEGTVTVEDQVTGSIESGYVVLLGVEDTDTEKDADYLAEKIVGLRIFEDADGKMNLSLQDTGGQMLVISQFTLLADARKGRRPNFVKAAKPELAKKLYDYFVSKVKSMGVTVEEGIFQTHMLVRIYNDGPVTILLESNKLF